MLEGEYWGLESESGDVGVESGVMWVWVGIKRGKAFDLTSL